MIAAASPDDDESARAAWAALRAARHGATIPAAVAAHPLCAMLRPVARPGPIVVAQLGQSLDGRIATVTGASHFINGPAGIDHLHRLRALVDAVVVGVGTVCADDCRLTVRRVEGASPARVVIDPAGRVPLDAAAFADDGARRLVIRAEGAPRCPVEGVETVFLPSSGRCGVAPADLVAALARRGLRRVLVEGGATTVSAFVAVDAVDRLHVMVAPLLVGSGREGLSLAPIRELRSARRPQASAYPLPGGDVLFDCDMRALQSPSDGPSGAAHEPDDSAIADPRRGRLHADG